MDLGSSIFSLYYMQTMSQQKNKTVFSVFWENMRGYRTPAILGIVMVIGNTLLDLVAPIYYKKFFDAFASGTPTTQLAATLIGIAFFIFFIHLGSWLCSRLDSFLTMYLQPHVMAALEQSSFRYLLGHSYQFFTDHFAGSLNRRVNRLTRTFEDLHDMSRDTLVPLVISLAGVMIVVFQRQAMIGWIIVVWALSFFLLNYGFARWKLKYDIERAKKDSEVGGATVDALSNAVNIKLFTGHQHEQRRMEKLTNELARMRIFGWMLGGISDTVQMLLLIGIELWLTLTAIHYWRQGLLTIGDFALFQGYILILFGQFSGFRRVIRRLYESFADAKEMVDLLNEPHGIQDVKNAKPLIVKQGGIEFKDTIFHYHKTRTVLDHLNLKIKPREKVALVGSSGAGKSTVMKLLFRFYDIDGGKILIDDQNILKVTQESLRDQIALVPQEPILFHRTLMDNIRYGRREATDEEVVEAAKKAHCHEFITSLPDGYETYVGERGIKLSGGERQRVAIARAILKDAPILLLDEATSSLDSESESLIQDALWQLMKNKTVIAIAHRLSTIMEMDRIVVMDQGKVVDSGTHEALLKKDGIYKTLWEIQAGGFLP